MTPPDSVRYVRFPTLVLAVLTGAAILAAPAARSTADDPGAQPAASSLTAVLDGQAPRDLDELRAMQDRVQEVVQHVVPCTVGLQIGPIQGSGVIVSEDGYMLTAAHVASRTGRDVTARLPDGRTVRGKTLGMNKAFDAGLIQLNAPADGAKWPHAEMADPSSLQLGEWCLAVGHPNGFDPSRGAVVRLGRVLALRSSSVRTDCPLVGGDSGGPLFDLNGKVIGIHSRIGGPLTFNVHIPIGTFRDSWDRMVKGESWGRFPGMTPVIGIRAEDDVDKARIKEIVDKSPAQRAGIQKGDVITRFAGQPVTTFESLKRLVDESLPGETVDVQVQRDGKSIDLRLVVGQREAPDGGGENG